MRSFHVTCWFASLGFVVACGGAASSDAAPPGDDTNYGAGAGGTAGAGGSGDAAGAAGALSGGSGGKAEGGAGSTSGGAAGTSAAGAAGSTSGGGAGAAGSTSVDLDQDGIDDALEAKLASDYLPFISMDPGDGCARSGLLFRLRKHPKDPALFHVIYVHLFEKDCGLTGHVGDDEGFAITINPAKPAPQGIVALKAISHQGTICAKTTTCGICPGESACTTAMKGGKPYPVLFHSKDKHGSYTKESSCDLLTCFDTCFLATASKAPPLVNVGEPGHPLVNNLSTQGFINAQNAWTEQALFDVDPWKDKDFGGAGSIALDLVDPAFDTEACQLAVRELQRWVEKPRPCSYVAERVASLENRVLLDVSPDEMDALLARGVRRFGPMYFRPNCSACQACISLRMEAGTFELRRRHKRVLKRNEDLRVSVRRPRVDQARLDLYERWHGARQEARGWEPSPLDGTTYAQVFAFPHTTGIEISYWLGGALVGVALSDSTPAALSAIYFYYDPSMADRSLGTLNVLVHLLRAKEEQKQYLYLGYWVVDCPSLRYKATFGPHEALETPPSFDETPVWVKRDPLSP